MREFDRLGGVMPPIRHAVFGVMLLASGQVLTSGHAVAAPVGPNRVAKSDDMSPIVAVIDRARLVKIPEGTQTLVIGNPTIADVTMLAQKNLMVLTPKAFGETNFIALDGQGNPLAESTIQVVAGADALVVQRGMDRESYSCAPRCQPTERLGDADKYISAVAAQAEQHDSRLANTKPPTSVSAPIVQ